MDRFRLSRNVSWQHHKPSLLACVFFVGYYRDTDLPRTCQPIWISAWVTSIVSRWQEILADRGNSLWDIKLVNSLSSNEIIERERSLRRYNYLLKEWRKEKKLRKKERNVDRSFIERFQRIDYNDSHEIDFHSFLCFSFFCFFFLFFFTFSPLKTNELFRRIYVRGEMSPSPTPHPGA